MSLYLFRGLDTYIMVWVIYCFIIKSCKTLWLVFGTSSSEVENIRLCNIKFVMAHFFRIILAALLVCGVAGFKSYQNQIPNGANIPHPCKPNFIWQGVGHQNAQGGGDRNPFGTAFKAAGLVSLLFRRLPMFGLSVLYSIVISNGRV